MSASSSLRRLLFWLLSLPLVLLLALLLAAGLAISTETGLRGLLALAERALPGQLSYGQVSGRLLGPLRIERLRYTDGALAVRLASGEFDWQPADLLDAALTVTRLHLDGLELQLPPSPDPAPPPEPFTLPDIQLPLAVNITDFQARTLRILPANAAPILIDAIHLQTQTEAHGLTLDLLDVWAPQGEVHLSGRLNPTGGYPLQIRSTWQLLTPDHGTVQGQGEIQGELRDRLRLTQRITGPATLELTGDVRQPLDSQPAWSAQATLEVADLKPFVPELAGQPLTARLDAKGVLTRFQGQGEVNTTLPELGPATLRFTAAGDEQAVQLDELRLTAAHRPLALTVKGDVQFAELRFNASGQWQSLVWPLTGLPQVESSRGDFTVQGTAQDYRFQLAADLQGPNLPQGRWTLNGQGSDQALRELKFSSQTLGGVLQGAAEVAWLPAVRWQATVNGENLNPGAHWKDVPGKLNLRLKSDGGLDDNGVRAHLLLEELAGALSGQTVRGVADLTLQNQNLTFKTLRLNAGEARLEAEGALAERWDLRWKLDAPQLKSLIPGLSGTVASAGKLAGSRDRPAVAATFTVQNLNYGDTRIQQARGEIDVDTGGVSRSRLQLTGQGLTLGGQAWQTVSLSGSGTPAAHELKAELAGEPGRFLLTLAGSLQLPAQVWQGRIAQLTLKDTVAGAWSLDQPATVRASAQEANLGAACLSSAPTRLCLQGQWSAARGITGRVQLSNLTPERFKTFLPEGVNLTTRVNGEATVSGQPGGAMQGKLNLTVAPGHLRMDADGQPLQITLNGATVRIETDGRTASGQAQLDLAQTGQAQATVQIQDPFGAARLNGRLNATLADLSAISLFVPQLQKVSGQLRADVTATGVLPKLALRGEIRLENAGAAIPEAGIKLQDLRFTAASDGQGPLRLSGSVRSGSGELQLSGTADPLQSQLTLRIEGQDFQALDTTDLKIQISPDLKLDIAQRQVRIEGDVAIPRAYLRPGGTRASAIRPSSDVVILNSPHGEAPPKAQGFDLYARVRVILGEEVQVETPAFKGRLKGQLLVEETPQLAPRGSGSIEVVAGNYRIFGEDIEIQRGRLLFSSSPLDNPGLDLRVARQSSNLTTGQQITAGAQIRGSLKQPKLTLFSTPKMPDADVLSYLVLGRSPQGGGSGGEAALLQKAAGAMGLGGGALTQGLGDVLGLDSLQMGSSGNSNGDTALMLGKYLSPNLYVGYGVGLFNAVSTFNVRYRVSKRLSFESSSSALGFGADLIYTLER